MSEPNLEDWQRLHAAAAEYAALAPWDWMGDDEVFGVADPETGEVGWCAVIGALGEALGLVVYLGDEGLQLYSNIQLDAPDTEDLGRHMAALWFMLGGREELEKRDRDVIRSLGLRFRGRRAWPYFRSLRPGYAPWFLEASEARYLTLALEQAAVMARRLAEDGPADDVLGDDERLLVRVRSEDDDGEWSDRLMPVPEESPREDAPHHDELRLARIGNKHRRGTGIWECGYFYSDALVAERGKRPAFATMFMAVDAESGRILHHHLGHPPLRAQEAQEAFFSAMETIEQIPGGLALASEQLLDALEPIADDLEIERVLAPNAPALAEARAGFNRFLAEGPG